MDVFGDVAANVAVASKVSRPESVQYAHLHSMACVGFREHAVGLDDVDRVGIQPVVLLQAVHRAGQHDSPRIHFDEKERTN